MPVFSCALLSLTMCLCGPCVYQAAWNGHCSAVACLLAPPTPEQPNVLSRRLTLNQTQKTPAGVEITELDSALIKRNFVMARLLGT